MGLQQIKSFYTAKEKHSKQPIEWEKNHCQLLICKGINIQLICKELKNLKTKRANNPTII
jgi:hypothetical protein